jgi:hypothetical protein
LILFGISDVHPQYKLLSLQRKRYTNAFSSKKADKSKVE